MAAGIALVAVLTPTMSVSQMTTGAIGAGAITHIILYISVDSSTLIFKYNCSTL